MRKAKILILLSCFLPILGIGQNINLVNGVPVTILDGTSLDHVIPADAGSVEISVRGGDGGQVRFSGIFCDDTTIKGGQGALIDVTFEVGNGPRQVPPGSRLRTFIGGRGAGWSQACGAPGAFFGGGGGSSAIFYLPPGADEFGVNWRMLVVAGGGGGAARPSAGFDWPGGGASQNETSGGSGGVAGVSNGTEGKRGELTGSAGGGFKSVQGSMVSGYYEDQQPILVQLKANSEWVNTARFNSTGGNGFTGGGERPPVSTGTVRSGGGGGGYSGGSVDYNRGGGGGGSHIASGMNIVSSSIGGGASGGGTQSSGYITIKSVMSPIITTAICQNQTVQLEATGQANFDVSQLSNGSIGFTPLSLTVNGQSTINYTCADVGSNRVTLNLIDNLGNTSSCVATVTVEDKTGPNAFCQDVIVELNSAGKAFINPCLIDVGSADGCGGFIGYSLSKTTFDCSNRGTNTVTMTLTDMHGNSNDCTSMVTVVDQMRPIANCKNTTVQLDANGSATITAMDINNGSTDGCGIANMSLNQASFGCAELGSNPVTLTVTDLDGNSSQCSASVIVEDKIAPVARCKDVILQVPQNGNRILAVAEIDNGSSDGCGIALKNLTIGSYGCGNLGTNTETLTVTDANGNSSSCTSTVTVVDQILPVAQCKNMTVQLNENGSVTINPIDINNGSNDACEIATMSLNKSTFGCDQLGAHTVTLTVKDASGNAGQCTSTVTVEDKTAPVASCKNITLQLEADGDIAIAAADIDNGSSDACGIASMTLGLGVYTCGQVGTLTETLMVTDVNGNTSNCTAQVTIESAPIARCKDINVAIEPDGDTVITPSDVDNGSSAVCGIASMNLQVSYFYCEVLGPQTQILYVTDNNGQTSTCTSTVTIVDNLAPELSCPADITVNHDPGMCDAVVNYPSPVVTDNCFNYTLVQSGGLRSGANFPIGTTMETFEAVDPHGNKSTCSFTVTVEGAPIALCKDITVEIEPDGDTVITPADVDDGSSAVCGIASMMLSNTYFYCEALAPYTQTLTVTDNMGQTASCTSTVTVVDNLAPEMTCPANIVVDNDPGLCGAAVTYITPTATDNCYDVDVVRSSGFGSGSVFPIGTSTESYTATDPSGNQSSCSFMVTVNKTGDPGLLSAYTVIGVEGVRMEANTVQSGGVGVVLVGEEVKLRAGTTVTAASTFVRSPELNQDEESQVTSFYEGQVASNLLPSFEFAEACDNDVEIPNNGGAVTLDQACYGKINVGKNVSLTFSGHAQVNIEQIELERGASIFFDQPTELLVEKKFQGGRELLVSNEGHEVWLFVDGKVRIERGSDVTANIYAMNKLEVEGGGDPTTMTGLFISGTQVDAKANVIWNWNTACLQIGTVSEGNLSSIMDDNQAKIAESEILEILANTELSVAPNPFASETTIRFIISEAGPTTLSVFGMDGRLVRQLQNEKLDAGKHQAQWDGMDSRGSQLPSGMYLVQLRVGEEVLTKKLLLQRR